MSLIERINQKLTLKNKAAAERPPNSELVLLLGRAERESLKSYIGEMSFRTTGMTLAINEINFDGNTTFLEMLVIPVDFEEYLDIVRKI